MTIDAREEGRKRGGYRFFFLSNIQYIEDKNIINWNDGQLTQVSGKRYQFDAQPYLFLNKISNQCY